MLSMGKSTIKGNICDVFLLVYVGIHINIIKAGAGKKDKKKHGGKQNMIKYHEKHPQVISILMGA